MTKRNILLTPEQSQLFSEIYDSSNLSKEIYYKHERGSGGTFIGICAILNRCVVDYNQRACISCSTTSILRNSMLPALLDIIDKYYGADITFEVNSRDLSVKFSNGSKIFFVSLDERKIDPEFCRLSCMSFHVGFIDNSSEVSNLAIEKLSRRIRENRGENSWKNKIIINLS